MGQTGSSGARILVVDDRESNRLLLQVELEEAGFEVLLADSGLACLEQAASSAPECIILDIKMPGIDGLETCRRLKADPNLAQIPVLFLTAHRANPETAMEALELGGNDFLEKPYSAPVLLARVSCQVALFRAQRQIEDLRQLIDPT